MVTARDGSKPVTLTMLITRAEVHATTGLLPVTSISIPVDVLRRVAADVGRLPRRAAGDQRPALRRAAAVEAGASWSCGQRDRRWTGRSRRRFRFRTRRRVQRSAAAPRRRLGEADARSSEGQVRRSAMTATAPPLTLSVTNAAGLPVLTIWRWPSDQCAHRHGCQPDRPAAVVTRRETGARRSTRPGCRVGVVVPVRSAADEAPDKAIAVSAHGVDGASAGRPAGVDDRARWRHDARRGRLADVHHHRRQRLGRPIGPPDDRLCQLGTAGSGNVRALWIAGCRRSTEPR